MKKASVSGHSGNEVQDTGFTCARHDPHRSGLDTFGGGGLLPESHPASLLVDPGFTDCFVTLETRSFGWLGLTCRQSDTQERLPPK